MLDGSVVRAGDAVLLRHGGSEAGDEGGGCLCVTGVAGTRLPSRLALGAAGAGHPSEVFILEPLAPLPRGTPLRVGDVLLLRSAHSGALLCAASSTEPLPISASADALPVAALPSTDAAPIALLPVPVDAVGWVGTAVAERGGQVPRAARPLLAMWQELVLLAAPVTAAATVASLAVAAVSSRMALCGGGVRSRHTTAAGEAVEAVSPLPFLDVLRPRGREVGDALLAPAAAATWSWSGAPRTARSSGDMAYAPLPALPPWVSRRPASTFCTALPPYALPAAVRTAVGDARTAPLHGHGGHASAAPAGATLPLPVQEALLVDALLSALLGIPGAVVTTTCAPDAAAPPPAPLAATSPLYGDALLSPTFAFRVAPSLQAVAGAPPAPPDPALAALAERMLPLARHYVRCRWLAEVASRPVAGRVAAAGAAAADHILREYAAVVSRLDGVARRGARRVDGGSRVGYAPDTAAQPALAPALTLQQLWFYLQPSLRTLAALEALLTAARPARGGGLLNVLGAAARDTGDDVTRTLALFLLQAAAGPYLAALDAWLYTGAVADGAGEFMVAQADAPPPTASPAAAAAFWGGRFALRPAMVPDFLAPHAAAVLLAGKYVHVLRACEAAAATTAGAWSIDRVAPYAAVTRFQGLDAAAYGPAIHAAAARASRLLLQRFTAPPAAGGFALLSRLATLKSFFLLAHGDYLTHFLDAAEGELAKEVGGAAAPGGGLVSLHKLAVMFEGAVRGSSADGDAHKGEVTVALAPASLLATVDAAVSGGSVPPRVHNATAATGGLKAYSVFSLDFTAAWPLNVVLSRTALERYQLLFRNLLFAKVVERAVVACWVAHQTCKELDMRATLALSYALRQRMLAFLQNIIYYQLAEVIEPLWHELLAALRVATSVDDVITAHTAFLTAAATDCLLTSPELLKLQTKLVTLCLLFANQITSSIEAHRLDDAELDARAGANRATHRARVQLEHGDYYGGADDDEEDGASVVSTVRPAAAPSSRGGGGGGGGGGGAAGGATRRRPSAATSVTGGGGGGGRGGSSAAAAAVTRDRARRKARLAVQTEAMQRTMAQAGWQAMIVKSSRMFDTLLRDFLGALVERTAGDYASHLRHLCERLDFNGFYTRHLGLAAAAPPAPAPPASSASGSSGVSPLPPPSLAAAAAATGGY